MCLRIVTDSTADLSADLLAKNNIKAIPLKVNFGEESYLDGKEISSEEFFAKADDFEELSATSQPSPGEFVAFYSELIADGADEIISIHISGKMSGSVQSAQLAAEQLRENCRIHVVDSKTVTAGLGLLVLEAARAAEEGKNADEIIAAVDVLKERMSNYFYVQTMDNLLKGGRIGSAVYIVAKVLNIKPILTIRDGLITSFGKTRGSRKAWEFMTKEFFREVNPEKQLRLNIVHGADREAAEKLIETMCRMYPSVSSADIILSDMGSVVGTHVGRGTLGLFGYNVTDRTQGEINA